jgi:hypothetical protein
MSKKDAIAEAARLQAVYTAAREKCAASKTPENMDATVRASREHSDFLVAHDLSPKSKGRACRAGRAQHALQAAMTAENVRRHEMSKAWRASNA